MNRGWGEEDDEDGIPDWMKASTYRNGGLPVRNRRSVEEVCADILKKPAIPVILRDPTKDFEHK
jgi:hypothetical protein